MRVIDLSPILIGANKHCILACFERNVGEGCEIVTQKFVKKWGMGNEEKKNG